MWSEWSEWSEWSKSNESRGPRIAIAACLAYFAARLVTFAIVIDPSIPPDEATHVGRVLAFATTWGVPEPSPDNYALGLLSERPFVYNWVLARWSNGVGGDLLWLRLANVAMALATATYGLRFIRIVTPDRIAQVLFLVLLTNTLMFTGIGAAVSYDNGTNLLGAASFYYLACLVRSGDAKHLAALAVAAGLGCLTKRSFLPVAALLAGAVLVHEGRNLSGLVLRLRQVAWPLVVAVAIVLFANVALYGGNWLEYRKLVPGFEQVVGIEAARQNRIFARDYLLDEFREGRLELREAMKETTRIQHPGDRESTRRQLAGLERRGDWRVAPHVYLGTWGRIMLDRTFGYFGHQVIYRHFWERVGYAAILLVALGLQLWTWRRDTTPLARFGGAIALAYAAVMIGLVNYPNYAARGILDAGVHGRYLFPVWVPLIGWLACMLTRIGPTKLRIATAVLVGGFFVYGDGPLFLLRATPAWFAGSP